LAGVTTAVTDLYSADGFHPTALLHGLTANMFIDAALRGYGVSLGPLSDQEIVSNAGLIPLGAGPTFFDVSPFVIVPEPPTLALALPGMAILLGALSLKRRRSAAARLLPLPPCCAHQ